MARSRLYRRQILQETSDPPVSYSLLIACGWLFGVSMSSWIRLDIASQGLEIDFFEDSSGALEDRFLCRCGEMVLLFGPRIST